MVASKFTTTPSPIEVVEKVNAVIDDVAGKASNTSMSGASDSSAGKSGLVPAPAAGDQDKFLSGAGTWKAVQTIIDFVYPIGSLYWSKKSTDPGTLFGGTWTRVKDKFILAAGDSYTQGNTGGAATCSLTTANMPAHSHTRGTMDITGTLTTDDTIGLFSTTNVISSGAFDRGSTSLNRRDGAKSCTFNPKTLTFKASNNWTGSTSSVGSGTAHNNMPPYVVYYCWERTA